MADEHDSNLVRGADIPAALGLLSRLPVPVNEAAALARGARASWAFPIAGLVLAAVAGLVGQVALWLSLPAAVAALLALASLIIITGAMHEDGLADSADGLWGGWDKARRLEIMKDSAIGTYGVLALGVSLLIRGAALTLLARAGLLGVALLIALPLSRAMLPALMFALPLARDGGLSRSVGRPSGQTAVLAGVLGLIPVLFFWPGATLAMVIAVGAVTLGCAAIAKAKIGGQTGDILGATQQMAEITALLVLLSLA